MTIKAQPQQAYLLNDKTGSYLEIQDLQEAIASGLVIKAREILEVCIVAAVDVNGKVV